VTDDETEKRDGRERCVHERREVPGSRKDGRVVFVCARGCGYRREVETVEPRAKRLGLD